MNLRGPEPRPFEERFWEKVAVGDPVTCWLWQAYRNRQGKGYGVFGVGGQKSELAHRIVWKLCQGPIPDGMRVLHHCDNPGCCNPGHLFLGTQEDNIADMVAKGRQGAPRGEEQAGAKLNTEKVQTALWLRSSKGLTYDEIAEKLGVSRGAIAQIFRGRGWRTAVGSDFTPVLCVGENSPHAKLTDAQVREIRTSDKRPSELADLYGVSVGHISKIRRNAIRKQVDQ